ncbi:MucBP domain-containing protein [Levilactobacillus zymae]|uniref:MucBP domain-containing protein n=1 Tax=Levilactobacillus zymae TaxID=267363 RepID=UPI0015604AA2|nr:MucBP domain-containing protein [Levilactobacillus zymae]
MKPTNRQRHQWLYVSATALALALVATTNETAHAETAADRSNEHQQVTQPSVAQAQQVTLTPSTPATDPTPAATADEVTEEPATPATTTDETPAVTAPTDVTENETADTDETPDGEEPAEVTTTEKSDAPASAAAPVTSTQPAVSADKPASTAGSSEPRVARATTFAAAAAPVTQSLRTGNVTTAATTIDDWMPNKLMQEKVLKALQRLSNPGKTWASVQDITQDDLALLDKLSLEDTYLDGDRVYSLEGLQYAVNLTYLSLNSGLNAPSGAYYGNVTDISPLAGLTKLTQLDIQHNRISDLTPLENLTNLKSLSTSFNRIADFRPLKDLPNLTDFTYGNQIIVSDTPAYVKRSERTAHLASTMYLRDGTQIVLTPKAEVGEPVQLTSSFQFFYKWYFSGSDVANNEVTTDGHGGLNFTNLKDQKSGITGTYNGTTVVPVENYYYLTGAYKEEGIVYFAAVQPYVLYDSAVTVHYQDEQGRQLAADRVLYGNVGDDYTTEQAVIDGYTFKQVNGNATGKFTDTDQEVTYVYTKDQAAQGTVTVHYVDEAGTALADPTTQTGDQDSTYTTTPVDIPGYTLSETPANATGTFTDGNQDVIYVYTKNAVAKGTITVHYVDETGKALADPTTQTGDQDSTYTTTPINIPGYTLSQTPANATGTFTDGNQNVIYVYTKNAVAKGTITVHYVDENGKVIAPATTQTGDQGSAYTTSPLDITGYTLQQTPTNATGLFTDGNQDVTYVYRATISGGGDGDSGTPDPEKPTPPTAPEPTPTQPETGGDGDQLVNGGDAAGGVSTTQPTAGTPVTLGTATGRSTESVKPATPTAKTLPQTDEQTTKTGLFGLVALAMSGLGYALFRRKN